MSPSPFSPSCPWRSRPPSGRPRNTSSVNDSPACCQWRSVRTAGFWPRAAGTLTILTRAVTCRTFTPDGELVASGTEGDDGKAELKVWDAAGWKEKELASLDTSRVGSILSVAFSQDGKTLAAGLKPIKSAMEPLRIWD